MSKIITLAHGSGGVEMNLLISQIRKRLGNTGNWQHGDDDAAIHDHVEGKIVFTTDSYVVSPQFFPEGNIGDIAFCGTINDLSMMGATPLGISLSLVLEEGLEFDELFKIIDAIATHSQKTGIPIVTGDTKVMERGSVDKIIITTSGIGVVDKPLTEQLAEDDVIIVSGGIAEHACALLARRYEIETDLRSDVKPLITEMNSIKDTIKAAKDLTRGGLAVALNELCKRHNVGMLIEDEAIPMNKGVEAMTRILGIEATSLACEGRMVVVCEEQHAEEVVAELKRYNEQACIIGKITKGTRVVVQTRFGKKLLPEPSGIIAPRIC